MRTGAAALMNELVTPVAELHPAGQASASGQKAIRFSGIILSDNPKELPLGSQHSQEHEIGAMGLDRVLQWEATST